MAKKNKVGKATKSSLPTVSGSGASQTPEMKRLEDVFRLMTSYGVGEVELEDDKGRLHARMPSAVVANSQPAYAPAPSAPAAAPVALALTKDAPAPQAALAPNQKKILSPFVGTFYRSSNPSSAPYCSEGQAIKKGQTLCIIEAMKLMNQIESDFDGKIVSVLIENGQPVEFGEALFIIE